MDGEIGLLHFASESMRKTIKWNLPSSFAFTRVLCCDTSSSERTATETERMLNLHFWYEIESHFLQLRIFRHESNSYWIWCVVVEVKVTTGWRCSHKVPTILERKYGDDEIWASALKLDNYFTTVSARPGGESGPLVSSSVTHNQLTADKLRTSSLILSSFLWPTHGQTPASPLLPDWSLINCSCSLLKSLRSDCGLKEKEGNIVDLLSAWFVCTNINLLAECARLSLTLSLTVSLILATPAPALLTTPEKNEPNEVAPALTLLVTVGCARWDKRKIIELN